MTKYKLFYKSTAKKDLQKLPTSTVIRIKEKLARLTENPYSPGQQKIRGYHNYYRLRVGVYRIIYEIQFNRLLIFVIRVAHRKDVYRGI